MMNLKGCLIFAFTSLQVMGGLNGAKDALEAREAAQSNSTDFKSEFAAVMDQMTPAQDGVNTWGFIGYIAGAEIGRRLPEPGQPS